MRTFPQMAAKYTYSRKKTRRTVHYQITEEAVAGQKKENSSLTSIPSGTDQPKSTGRNMRFQKGLTFFQQRTVELFCQDNLQRKAHCHLGWKICEDKEGNTSHVQQFH